jgi:YHS domain-containing protein
MGKTQIAVEVAGKVYYGCCAMCKEKLEQRSEARSAVDPVSGAHVDKAVAIIGRDPAGAVFYFESEATFARYKP